MQVVLPYCCTTLWYYPPLYAILDSQKSVAWRDADPESALFHYNLAEVMLYRMVKEGDFMYKKSLRLAIEGQARARATLSHNIPTDEWIDEPI